MSANNEEMKTIKQFIITLMILIIIVLGIYLFTKLFVTKEDTDTTTTDVDYINPKMAIVGTMLKKSEDNYYVILYNTEDDDASTYAALLNKYSAKDDYVTTYRVDLSNPMNSKYIAEGSDVNTQSDTLSDLRFGAITLLEVKNGKIIDYTTGYVDGETDLEVLFEDAGLLD